MVALPMIETQPRWLVVHIKPNREHRAFRNIAEQGYDAYLPQCEHMALRKLRGGKEVKRIRVAVPLFTGYLFVAEPIGRPWSPIANTRGVLRVLTTTDGTPKTMPDEEIAEIRRRERGGLVPVLRPDPRRRGQKLRIKTGPFADRIGLYQSSENGRVKAMLELLNKSFAVEFDEEDVEDV